MRASTPPDFRYIGLQPAPSPRRVRMLAGASALGTFSLGVSLANGSGLGAVALAGVAGVMSGYLVLCGYGVKSTVAGAVQVPLAIVPWGVLVHREEGLRILRWAAVRSIGVDLVCTKDEATPITRYSLVTVRTDRETYAGRAPGAVSLEVLEANFERYAEEAARPVAADLDGTRRLDDLYEPNFGPLLDHARRLLRSDDTLERLRLAPADYRRLVGGHGVSEQAVRELKRVLNDDGAGPADPRPLAAVLSAELRAKALLPWVTRLTTSPHPLVAAVARAASMRLGADIKRVGVIEEIADFLPAEDIVELRSWAATA